MRFALIGNPGVGKSTIFNQLTGLGVEVNRYPGSVVALEQGNVCYKNERFEITDLPGIYSLDGSSDEEALARTFIDEKNAACLIAVLDATRLERNLYLLLQVAEYRMPMIAVLNKIDEAERSGLTIDTRQLSELLGIDVIAVAALQGRNIDRIVPAALISARVPGVMTPYDHHIEAALTSLEKTLSTPRHRNLLALQGLSKDPLLRDSAEPIAREIEQRHHMSLHQIIATNRHNFSRHLAGAVVSMGGRTAPFDLDSLLTRTIPGIPVLVAVMVFLLLTVFVIGSWLEGIIVPAFTTYVIAPFLALGLPPLPAQIGLSLLVALQAGFGIAFPFILIFYLEFSFLEDTGYMTRAAFLADRAMHRLGLHGEALIPMMIGFGCTVPAIMSIRILKTRREKTIAAFLITMIPCSARTVVIAGIVAAFIGLFWAFTIYLTIFFLIIITAVLLARITPGEQFGMIVEMTPLRRPQASLVLTKAWIRIKEFLFIAIPVLIITSIILGLLQYSGILDALQGMIAPLMMSLLGLPPYAFTALLFGIFRKELAFETLAVLGGTADLGSIMSDVQLYTFAIISVLFIPCISTIAVLYRNLGARIAVLASAYSVGLGLFIGALINLLMK